MLVFLCLDISAKVLIITHSYSRPDLIALQVKTFKALLQDEYEFVVFNDASNENMAVEIETMCIQQNIKCMRIPQEIHTQPYLPRNPNDDLQQANIRHANCIQYSLDVLGFDHDGVVFIVDSDMFLIRPFSIEKYMQNKDVATLVKRSYHPGRYFCPAICFLSMDQIPDKRSLNFNVTTVNNSPVDSGGATYYYWIKHPNIVVEYIKPIYCSQLYLGDLHYNLPANNFLSDDTKLSIYFSLGFNDQEIKFLLKNPDTFEFYLDNHFIHYRGASTINKNERNYQQRHLYKMRIFNELIDDVLNPNFSTPHIRIDWDPHGKAA